MSFSMVPWISHQSIEGPLGPNSTLRGIGQLTVSLIALSFEKLAMTEKSPSGTVGHSTKPR